MNRILTAKELLSRWKADGRPERVVFTNGCFDLLHPGHIRHLAAARKLGDYLVVGVNDDASARRIKGPTRPFLSLEVRTELLASLKPVDCVIPFGEDTPLKLIEAIRPDILVKGGDYSINEIVGAREVESWGGAVHVLPLEGDFSSSSMALAIADSITAEISDNHPQDCKPYAPGMGDRAAGLKEKRDLNIRNQVKRRSLRKKGGGS